MACHDVSIVASLIYFKANFLVYCLFVDSPKLVIVSEKKIVSFKRVSVPL